MRSFGSPNIHRQYFNHLVGQFCNSNYYLEARFTTEQAIWLAASRLWYSEKCFNLGIQTWSRLTQPTPKNQGRASKNFQSSSRQAEIVWGHDSANGLNSIANRQKYMRWTTTENSVSVGWKLLLGITQHEGLYLPSIKPRIACHRQYPLSCSQDGPFFWLLQGVEVRNKRYH